jgi:hypothetical protein
VARTNDAGTIDTRLTAGSSKRVLSVTNTSSGTAVGAVGRPIVAGGSIAAPGNGPALEVQGVATFSRSGVIEFTTQGASVVEVAVPGGLKESSHVLALAQNLTTTSGQEIQHVVAAEPNVATGKVNIYLRGNNPGVSVKIAWFVFG